MKRKSISEYNKLVVYIGTKSPKVDKVFGTDEIMYPGDTIEVISDVANEMVKCTGVYTFPNTPAFAAFVSDNPELALEKGLVDEDGLKAQQDTLKTPKSPLADTNSITPAKEESATDEQSEQAKSSIDDIIKELDALPNKGAIQEWATLNGIGEVTGQRHEMIDQIRTALTTETPDA